MGQQREAEIGEAAGGESERVREREQWKEEREREQNRKRHAQREAALGPDLPQVPAQRLLGWLMLLFSVSRSHWCCSLSLCLQVSLGGSRSCLGEGMASAVLHTQRWHRPGGVGGRAWGRLCDQGRARPPLEPGREPWVRAALKAK